MTRGFFWVCTIRVKQYRKILGWVFHVSNIKLQESERTRAERSDCSVTVKFDGLRVVNRGCEEWIQTQNNALWLANKFRSAQLTCRNVNQVPVLSVLIVTTVWAIVYGLISGVSWHSTVPPEVLSRICSVIGYLNTGRLGVLGQFISSFIRSSFIYWLRFSAVRGKQVTNSAQFYAKTWTAERTWIVEYVTVVDHRGYQQFVQWL